MKYKIEHDIEKCHGCGLCTVSSKNWNLSNDCYARPFNKVLEEIGDNQEAADVCPVGCIKIIKYEN